MRSARSSVGLVHGLPRRPLDCPPRRRLSRGAADDGVRLACDKEGRAPVVTVTLGELKIPALPRHPGYHVTDAPRVQPAVEQAQLGLASLERGEAEGGKKALC